ncbi:MAG: glycosyltransferase 61 family protein [Acetobacteraceae bacterium]
MAQGPITNRSRPAERWRAFDPDWYRFAYPMMDQLLRQSPEHEPEQVYLALGPVLRQSPNPYFCESWYLDQYPDVAAMIRSGEYRSGFDHYCRHGHHTLSPHWLFNLELYRQRVTTAYRRPYDAVQDGDAYDHFLRIGQFQGLSGHWLFDPHIYATLAPYDVRARLRQDGAFTTLLHHLCLGDPEPVVSLLFDPVWYRQRYPHVAEEIRAGRWRCGLQHYLQCPDAAGLDPNPHFSEPRYRAYFEDVQAAIRDKAFRNGFEHFLRHGLQEARATFVPGPAGEAVDEIPQRTPPVSSGFPLRTQSFSMVTFLPAEPGAAADGGWRVGAIGSDGRLLDAFPSRGVAVGQSLVISERLTGPHIYGGTLGAKFGQLLLGGLSRLWFLRQHPDLPVIWQSDRALLTEPWPDLIAQLWRLLGLDRHRHVHVKAPVLVEQVILPDAGRQTMLTMHPRQASALAVHRATGPGQGRLVWLSRRGLPDSEGRLEPEEVIEALLQARGWSIVQPESLTLADHVAIFATADVVAGAVGDAFHAALLCAEPSARLVLVTRPGVPPHDFDLIAEARGLQHHYIMPDTLPASGSGAESLAWVADAAALVDRICAAAG